MVVVKEGDGKGKGKVSGKGKNLQKEGIRKGKMEVSGKGKDLQNVGDGKGKWKVTGKGRNVHKEGDLKGKGVVSGSVTTVQKDGEVVECQTDSDSDDGDYEPVGNEEGFETDDSLGDSELRSDDDEYRAARVGLRLQHDVICDVNWNEVSECSNVALLGNLEHDVEGGVESGFISDYVASDEDVISDSTDEDESYRQKRCPPFNLRAG